MPKSVWGLTGTAAPAFNPDIRELYEFVPDGTPLIIVADGPVTLPASRGSLQLQDVFAQGVFQEAFHRLHGDLAVIEFTSREGLRMDGPIDIEE